MTDYLRLVLAVFTCYRLARMLALDDGPFFIFKRMRYWAKDRAFYEADKMGMLILVADSSNLISDRHFGKWHNLAEGLSCPFCIGVWLSLPLLALLIWSTYYGDLFLLLMAISGGQVFLQSLDKKTNASNTRI